MPLSTYSKLSIYIALAFGVSACSYFLPSTTPNLGGLLVDRGDTRPFETPLPVNTTPKRMALGHSFTIGVKADGTVWSWGSGSSGELGRGDYNEQANDPRVIPNMTDFVEVVAGSRHVLALRKDGTVWAWGNNEKGQLGFKEDGHNEPDYYRTFQKIPKQIPDLKNIVSISAGGDISVVLDKEGTVYTWGRQDTGRNGEQAKSFNRPQKIYHHPQAVRVIALGNGAAVLTSQGKLKVLFSDLYEWSDIAQKIANESQIGINENKPVFELISPFPVVDVSSSRSAQFFLCNDGSVLAAGDNSEGDLGQGNFDVYKGLVKIKNIDRIVQLASSGANALDKNKRLWMWGANIYWRPDLNGGNSSKTPYPISFKIDNAIDFIEGDPAIALGMSDGSVFFMQEERLGIRGTGKPSPQHESDAHLIIPEKSLWTWK